MKNWIPVFNLIYDFFSVLLNPNPHGLLNELKPTGGGSKGPPYQKHSKRLDFVTKLSAEVGSEVNFR